ncbi:hypothetical protein [Streptomyces sp. NPDC056660]|uniref:hypothetical protein n=1 Tax=Streptomyces sp. NPDC056660 TaxID=3345897 RepID=UPI0036741269
MIVHPRSSAHADRVLRIDGPRGVLGVIRVLGVDTHEHPEKAVAWLGTVLS